MAVKGAIAKEAIIKKLAEVFGEDWIGEVDKKYYVWAKEGGERVQIAIALTCPKNMVEASMTTPTTVTTSSSTTSSGDWDFSDEPVVSKNTEKVEISDKEKETIALLMAQLGL